MDAGRDSSRTELVVRCLSAAGVLYCFALATPLVLALRGPVDRPSASRPSAKVAAVSPPALAPGENRSFIGPAGCKECHADKYEGFIETGHARSFCLPTPESVLGDFSPGHNQLRTGRDELWYEMTREGDRFAQTSHTVGPQGPAHFSRQIDLVMGSGKNAQAAMYWQGDQLFQMPVVYFTPLGGWANAPGFSNRFAMWDRPMGPRCLECHSTYFEHVAGSENRYRQDNFLLGISCERCHGRGSEHAEFHRLHPEAAGGRAIVNPSALLRARQLEMCGLCHGSVGTPVQPPFSYRVGELLEQYLKPDDPAETSAFVHSVNQVQRLSQSRCFAGDDTMTCTTCHDPHRHERGDVAMFSAKCLTCHQMDDCGKFSEVGENLRTNCIDCHMPMRDDESLPFNTIRGHKLKLIRLRDHRIGVYPDDTTQMLKEWFRELPNDPKSQQRELDSRMADAAQLRRANLLVAQDQLAAAAQGAQALTADPIYGAAAYELLGRIARLQNDDAGSRALYQKAVAADPERESALDGLARSHLLLGDDALAAAHWQALLKLNDRSLAARAGLAWLWSTSPEAEFRSGARAVAMIESACLSSPTPDIDALDALAAAYAECGRFKDALRVAEQAIVAARTARDDARGDGAEARYELYLKSQPFRRPRMNIQGRQP
ncbi:MAG: hypothetical protein K1X71_16530 [Pirellulales bacterium]|nr:hypothetical protein [Pirellulales bacterium]